MSRRFVALDERPATMGYENPAATLDSVPGLDAAQRTAILGADAAPLLQFGEKG